MAEPDDQTPKYIPLSIPIPPGPMDKHIHNDPPYELPPTFDSFKYKPEIASTFNTVLIKELIAKVLREKLEGKNYSPEAAAKWSREISTAVNTEVKELGSNPRYKHVVQVTLAPQTGAGCLYVTRCCWDPDTDDLASEVFKTSSFFCVCTVFGVYLY